jgi:hypothetical protein
MEALVPVSELPTIRELIALVNTNPFLGTDRICSWLVVLCAPRWVEDGAAPVTWRPLVGRSRRIGEACKSRRLK